MAVGFGKESPARTTTLLLLHSDPVAMCRQMLGWLQCPAYPSCDTAAAAMHDSTRYGNNLHSQL